MVGMNIDLVALLHRSFFPKLLCIFFGLLLCSFIFTRIQWSLQSVATSSTVVSQQSQEDPAIQKSLGVPLFGRYAEVDVSQELHQSMLDLQLIGIMYSAQAKQSQALIRTASGEEQGYGVGDELPGGAVIKQIELDHVLIVYQGEVEVLNLPKTNLQFEPVSQPLITK